jgi:hypothetical protein
MQTETITCLAGTAPLIIAVFISLISLAYVFIQLALYLPQYFKDIKDSRDKKILNAIREEVTKEIHSNIYPERSRHLFEIDHLLMEKRRLERLNKDLNGRLIAYKDNMDKIDKVKNMFTR